MTLREQAYRTFTEHLLTQRLVQGQFVSQRDLAAATHLPLGAIREMIPRLEAEGLVKAFPQRGLQVMAVHPRLVRDAFQMRELIEVGAILHYVRHAPDSSVARQRAMLDEVLAAAATGPIDDLLLERAQTVDWGFHDAIVEHMGNALIDNVHRVNAIRIRLMMQESVRLSAEALPPALGEHVRILDAIAARDELEAAASLRAHLMSARRRALAMEEGESPALEN